jgi:hypothetical protein
MTADDDLRPVRGTLTGCAMAVPLWVVVVVLVIVAWRWLT